MAFKHIRLWDILWLLVSPRAIFYLGTVSLVHVEKYGDRSSSVALRECEHDIDVIRASLLQKEVGWALGVGTN